MIDLHVHVLPGVDDGPGELREAVEMCRRAAAEGIDTLVATPHQRHPSWPNDDGEALRAAIRRLQLALGERPRILDGAEIHVDSGLLDDLDRFPDCGLLPLAGSRFLLLEFPGGMEGPEPRSLVHELSIAGWRPILAHAERVQRFAEQPDAVAELVRAGAMVQITAMSVTGGFGRPAQLASYELLDRGLVDFVATDGHDLVRRPPSLAGAYREIAHLWGADVAQQLMVANPGMVVRAVDEPGEEPRPALQPGAAGRWEHRDGEQSVFH